jgi:hypothetical protein
MNVDNVRKWLAALRSGEYAQGKSAMFRNGSYCCLGVACEVAGIPMNSYMEVAKWIGVMSDETCYAGAYEFVRMNDELGNTFSEIADHVERKLQSQLETATTTT